MKFCFVFLSACLLCIICFAQSSSSVQLVKKWETDTSIRTPESVLWNAAQHFFYVSCINGGGDAKDGDGFICRLGADGKVIQLHWINGLNAPKGMGQYANELYAADLDQLVIMDKKAGVIKQKITIPGAKFLNDIAVDGEGNVYISDTRENKVYRYYKGKVSELITDPAIAGANGLLVWKHKLWILTSGGIYNWDPATKKLNLFSDEVKGGDGITTVNNNDLIVSRWQGEVYYVNAGGHAIKLLDTKADHKNTADCWYYADKHLLVIPTFNGNVVDAYEVK